VFFDHIATPERLRAFGAAIRLDRARQAQGPVRGRVLAETAKAHADMESRKTTGKLPLVP
jgi:NADPH2:quinone reductase